MQDAGQGHLVEHLPKNIGFGMGLEFRESINLLKAGNERNITAGMVFNVAVGAWDAIALDSWCFVVNCRILLISFLCTAPFATAVLTVNSIHYGRKS